MIEASWAAAVASVRSRSSSSCSMTVTSPSSAPIDWSVSAPDAEEPLAVAVDLVGGGQGRADLEAGGEAQLVQAGGVEQLAGGDDDGVAGVLQRHQPVLQQEPGGEPRRAIPWPAPAGFPGPRRGRGSSPPGTEAACPRPRRRRRAAPRRPTAPDGDCSRDARAAASSSTPSRIRWEKTSFTDNSTRQILTGSRACRYARQPPEPSGSRVARWAFHSRSSRQNGQTAYAVIPLRGKRTTSAGHDEDRPAPAAHGNRDPSSCRCISRTTAESPGRCSSMP